MVSTLESGYTSTLSLKLSIGDTTMTVATPPTITAGRVFIQTGTQKEWIAFTGVSGSILTGLVRQLSTTADPATSLGSGYGWIAGTEIKIVEMHDQSDDKQVASTIPGTKTHTAPIIISGSTTYLKLPSLTTTQRDALVGANGQMIYNSTTGEINQYLAGAWSAVSAGSTQPNASTIVAGKEEIATSAESIAGTNVGGTLAFLSVLPSDIAANTQSGTFTYAADAGSNDTYVISLTPALTAYTTGQTIRFKANTINTGACTLNVNGLGAKSIKTQTGTDPANGLIAANEVVTLVYDGTNFVINKTNPIVLYKDVVTFTYNTATASGTQTINHSLGVAPVFISLNLSNTTNNSNGAWDGTDNACIYGGPAPGSGNSTSYSIRSATSGSDFATGAISGVTTSDFTITWTKAGSASGTVYILAELLGYV